MGKLLFKNSVLRYKSWYLIILVIFAIQHLYGDIKSDVDRDREDYDYDQARPPRPSLGKFNNVIFVRREDLGVI